MPVATEVIRVRTRLDLQKQIAQRGLRKGGKHTIAIICNGCNHEMLYHEKKVEVVGSFLSVKCFADFVNSFKEEFGFSQAEKIGPGEAEELLEPLEDDFVSNLYKLKTVPTFLEPHNPVRES